MEKSSKPIIEHIPQFLDYCRKVGLSDKTYENYRHYLKKFILWLKKESKSTLLPHELAYDDIQAYKLYLSRFINEKGRPLKKVTQNYYLIALRALLNYFTAKDVESLYADKISLPRAVIGGKTVKFLNLEQIEKLLLVPNTKKLIGLRDRAILETLISTGLKISQITKLNRNQLDDIPGEALSWIKKYLETREDKSNALFINYKARKDSIGGRLTARSIERIVNYYGRKANLSFFITPEILRRARASALLNEDIKIKDIKNHKISLIKNYNRKVSLVDPQEKEMIESLPPTWDSAENNIKKEINWLKDNIPVLPESYKANPPILKCDECILRKIAILIVSGRIKAAELRAEKYKDLWNGLTKKINLEKISHHGQEWHRKMMDVIYEYFKLQNCKVVLEPTLNYGRADLGIYSNSSKPLYIEVGTVSLFKLWYNLSTMKNVNLLVIPSGNNAIEFKV